MLRDRRRLRRARSRPADAQRAATSTATTANRLAAVHRARTGADDRAEPLAVVAGSPRSARTPAGGCTRRRYSGPVYRIQDGAATPCSFPAPTVPPGTDTTAPRLTVAIGGLKTALKRRRLRLTMRCDEACRTTITTRLRNVRRLKTAHRPLAVEHEDGRAAEAEQDDRPPAADRAPAPRGRAHQRLGARHGHRRQRSPGRPAGEAQALKRKRPRGSCHTAASKRILPRLLRERAVRPGIRTPSRQQSISHYAVWTTIGHASTASWFLLRKPER